MKILGVSSSLRAEGVAASQHRSFSRTLLQVGLAHVAAMDGVETEIVDLGDYRIAPELGSYSSNENFCLLAHPRVEDEAGKLFAKIVEADGVIFASPTYWGYPSATLKNLIDRMIELDETTDNPGGRRLEGKVAGAIATAKFDGSSRVAQDILSMANYLGFIIPPHAFAFHTSRTTTSVMEDDREFEADYFARRNACTVAENVVRMVRLVKGKEWRIFQEFTHPLSAEQQQGKFDLKKEAERFEREGYFHEMNVKKGLV
jgi:multimeric flavodoxin WrbA